MKTIIDIYLYAVAGSIIAIILLLLILITPQWWVKPTGKKINREPINKQ